MTRQFLSQELGIAYFRTMSKIAQFRRNVLKNKISSAEAKIFEHFRQLTQKRIAILISHRFSTVRMASQIIVIENGRVIERGSHEELMELKGHYANLFSLQAAGYK